MNRDDAINWCIKNKADFNKPYPFPPPEDWMWVECDHYYCLTLIFTANYDDDGDIEPIDVFLRVAAKRKNKTENEIKEMHGIETGIER